MTVGRMSKDRVAVLKVVSSQLSVTAAAVECGMSRGHLHRPLRRYRDGGLDAVEPRSRRPHVNPRRTSDGVRARIVALRTELSVAARGHFRLRYDVTDSKGAMTLRRAGRLYHLNRRRDPGRWPGSQQTGSSHLSPMTRLRVADVATHDMARPTGFEPATFGSGGRRSIH